MPKTETRSNLYKVMHQAETTSRTLKITSQQSLETNRTCIEYMHQAELHPVFNKLHLKSLETNKLRKIHAIDKLKLHPGKCSETNIHATDCRKRSEERRVGKECLL